MEDRIKQCIAMLREGSCCSVCVNAFPSVDWPYPCEERTATNNNMDEAANIIESLVAQLEAAQPKWISVEERLPDDGVDVLVWFEYFRYGEYNRPYRTHGISFMFQGRWSGFVNGTSGWTDLKIIAWIPLPSAPEDTT